MFRKISGAAACLLILLFFSCSRAEPAIEYGFINLVYYPESRSPGTDGDLPGGASASNVLVKGAPVERFSFFVIPADDDGIDNISELHLYNDREGLVWKLETADWIRIDEGGKTWIGSRNIAMPGGGILPRGQYRALVINKGGEKTERAITFDGPEDPLYPYPSFSLADGRFHVDSEYPVNRFLCFDEHGAEIQIAGIPYPEGTLSDLKVSNSVRSIALWAEDEEHQTSALTEAVIVR